MNNFFVAILFWVAFSSISYAQKPRKFGAITNEEMQMSSYPGDSTAKAVILYEYGTSNVGYINNDFEVTLQYHKIVKFFDDDELDRANITLKYPDHTGVYKFKASTYNLVDGKVVESEVSKKDIHTEQLVDGITEKKFAFPDVKPGSIIEYTYQIKTGSIAYLNAWTFQSTIPVAWSEYIVRYPEYFNYKTIMRGYIPLSVADVKNTYVSIGGSSVSGKEHRYVATNVPAFESESYMTASKNYISKIDFELQSVQFPGYFKEFFSDFNGIQKLLMDDIDFGQRLGKVGFMKDEIEALKASHSDDLELAKAIFSYVQKHSTWNKHNSIYATENFKTVLDEETNSGMINLFLVSVLRKSGLNADPVIISTRDHGIVNPAYALLKEYNYVIAQVKIEDKSYLLDATDDFVPFGVLPERCLNGNGRLISENTNHWVDLKSLGIRQTTCMATFDLDEEGAMAGNLNYNFNGYRGIELKKEIKRTGKQELLDEYAERDGWEISNATIKGEDDTALPLSIDLELAISDKAESLGDRIYLTPLAVGQTKENPFRLEKRMYPVDFTCPRRSTYMIKYKIPEGYEVDALPKPLGIALPNKAGKYIFSVNVQGDQIITTVQYQMNQVVFIPGDYVLLKEFFAQIVNKEAEQIVLKAKI